MEYSGTGVNANRLTISSGSPWEPIVGYSRAVRVGNLIEVSGTTAMANGEVVGVGDAYVQTKHILEGIKYALEQAGSSIQDVVRTRIYVTDISQWEAVGKAHGEVFAQIMPASSMIEIKSLINPALLVEIEATAVIQHI